MMMAFLGDHENDFVAEMEPLYLSDGTSLTTQKWNDERKTILRDALTQHLYPLFQNEVRIKQLHIFYLRQYSLTYVYIYRCVRS